MIKKIFMIFVIGALCIGVAGVGTGWWLIAQSPMAHEKLYQEQEKKVVWIPKGTSLRELTQLLSKGDFLKYPELFYYVARVKGLSERIPAGEYAISTRISILQFIQTLPVTKPVTYPFVIPEGWNMFQIADALVQAQLIKSKQEFLSYVRSSETLAKYDLSGTGAVSLEGYLFPDTYEFTRMDDIPKIVRAFVDRFRSQYNPDWTERARGLGLTNHEVIILASVIEKETGVSSERPLISSVFHNRLKKGMKLESDPTIIYGIYEGFNGNLTRKDIRAYTPYNTYRVKALPLGPIANPGLESIRAALYPATSSYFFFVSRNDKSHYFSGTYSEHLKAVDWYMKKRSEGTFAKIDFSTVNVI